MLRLVAMTAVSLLIAGCGRHPPATAVDATPTSATAPSDVASATQTAKPQALPPIVDVPDIAGKSQAEVSTVLGNPTSCETIKQGRKCLFDTGETEVVFIAGKADWISVEALDDAPYSADALPLLGFKKTNPSFSDENVIRWNSIHGFHEISIFPGQSGIDYALIKTVTP